MNVLTLPESANMMNHQVQHTALIRANGSLSKSLKKLNAAHCLGQSEAAIHRLLSNVRGRYAQYGITDFLHNETRDRFGDEYYSTLPLATFEWVQNAIEHGAHYNGDVVVTAFAADDTVGVMIDDPGPGFNHENMQKRYYEHGSVLYDAAGYAVQRGCGSQGVLSASDVTIDFEQLSDGFRTTLQTHRSQISRLLSEQRNMTESSLQYAGAY